jgi:exopolyphosphatase/guanosine-5'-triphosphate,3'-diphosphate pyrophosphatase
MKFAGIDIGSNAMRLLIGEVFEKDNKVHVSKLSLVRLPIRLGGDVFDTGRISATKEHDFIRGMEAFKIIMDIHQVANYRALATSAMRNAENGYEVAKKIFSKTGIEVEIIDGDKEANIILSTFHLLTLEDNTPYLYIDVGGGSTEISLIIDGKSRASHSFKIGTVRMLQHKYDESEWDEMLAWVKILKNRFHPKVAIGSGGNINKIIKLCCFSNEQILKVELMQKLYEEMEALSVEERMQKWDLRNDRADVIVPASEIYLKVLEQAEIANIYVPKIGLADGMLYQLYREVMANQT